MNTSIEKQLFSREAHVVRGDNGVPVIKFKCFEHLDWLTHGFSTREGGVSKGIFESMNLSFTRGDDPEAAMENFRRFGEAIGMECEHMVFTQQTHTTNIRVAGQKDRGKGILVPRDYENIDGLITNEPDVALVTFFADCVPLFFADPEHHAIAASHSGWRGTVAGMGMETVRSLEKNYGSCPQKLIAVIGPSICGNCYEVSEDVAEAFCENFPENEHDQILTLKNNGKYMLDLWKANELILLGAGLLKENIHVSGLCTHCHPDHLWSHRTLGGDRGSLAGFMMIKS